MGIPNSGLGPRWGFDTFKEIGERKLSETKAKPRLYSKHRINQHHRIPLPKTQAD